MTLFPKLSRDGWASLSAANHEVLISELGAGIQLLNNRQLEWAASLRELCEWLAATEPTTTELALFWIRLHGLLHEFGSGNPSGGLTPTNQIQEKISLVALGLRKKKTAISIAVSSDEMTYAEFKRNLNCHPYPETYFVRAREKKGNVSLIRKRKVVGSDEDTSLEAIRAILLRVEQGETEAFVARRIARRLSPLMRAYDEALRQPHQLF